MGVGGGWRVAVVVARGLREPRPSEAGRREGGQLGLGSRRRASLVIWMKGVADERRKEGKGKEGQRGRKKERRKKKERKKRREGKKKKSFFFFFFLNINFSKPCFFFIPNLYFKILNFEKKIKA